MTAATATPEAPVVPMPTNVITAIARVMAEMGGIGKSKPKDSQIAYAYRGIDAICAAAQPLLGSYGVVIVPTAVKMISTQDITVNGKPWVDQFVEVDWTIYGPGGSTDMITSTTQGLGRDNSDKAINKACTGAFKNLLLRLLCIGDPKDDADQPEHQNNVTDNAPRPAPSAPALTDDEKAEATKFFAERIETLSTEDRAIIDQWAKDCGRPIKTLVAYRRADLEEQLAALAKAGPTTPPVEQAEPEAASTPPLADTPLSAVVAQAATDLAAATGRKATGPQLGKLTKLFDTEQVAPDDRNAVCAGVLGRPVANWLTELTVADTQVLTARLEAVGFGAAEFVVDGELMTIVDVKEPEPEFELEAASEVRTDD
jgi:hypothetical protein